MARNMTTPRHATLVVLLTLLVASGCARLTLMTSEDIPAAVNSAREAGDFNKAWYYLEKIRDTHPQYEQVSALRSPLLQDIEAFEAREIQRARQLAGAGRWNEAFEALDKAQSQWRQGEAFAEAKVSLEKREALLFNRLRTELLTNEARWLAAQLETVEQLETLHLSKAGDISEAMQQRRNELVKALTELGMAFAQDEDWVRTRDLLGSAQLLSPGEPVPPQLATARQQLSVEANRHRRAREEQAQNRALQLLDTYESSGSLADLLTARDYISENNQSGQLDQYASRLEAICQQRFQLGLQEGDALYANGRYEDAFALWESIARIYPDDEELAKKMERARKVLSNLRALSDS